MVNCSILNCKNRSKKGGVIRFFSFPKEEMIANAWLQYCRPKTTIRTGSVCSVHFLSSDHHKPLRHILMNESPRNCRTLKPDAVPSLHINSIAQPSSCAKPIIDRRIYQAHTFSASCIGEKSEIFRVSNMNPIIIVHGGAGDIPQSRVKGKLDGMKTSVTAGYEVLKNGGSALDAVEAAVVSMEKDENFNAGYGSVLTLRGEVEMEASIMRGQDLNVGGVTLVKEFLHPISIAHKVLTDSPHSLLGGEGAKMFALEKGFKPIPPESLISENAKKALENFLKHGDFGRTEIGPKDEGGVGTVGAVAIDCQGHVAAATSTGGMSGKAVGRIGDTPQIGSGTYADDLIGGVSTTGHGESILKYCLAHSIIKLMECGTDANTATTIAVKGMTSRLRNTAGAITLSKDGDVGVHFSSKRMSWAYVKDGQIFYGIEPGEILQEEYQPKNC